jgi:hypothetical protein
MKIVTPLAKLVSDMKQVGVIMQADWVKKAGPDGEAIIASFNKLKAAKK